MRISARNVLKGTVTAVAEGAVNGVVTIDVGGRSVKADITMDAIRDLGLEAGVPAYAVVKATNVMFAAGGEKISGLSARNQLPGVVDSIEKGAVNGHVALKLADGTVVKGGITNEAIDELGLAVGEPAVAIVKSTDVMVAVD